MTVDFETSTGVLRVSGDLDIGAVTPLRDALSQALSTSNGLAIDLTDVTFCDAAGLQVLLSTRKTAASTGKQLRFVSVGDAVAQTCVALGFSLHETTQRAE